MCTLAVCLVIAGGLVVDAQSKRRGGPSRGKAGAKSAKPTSAWPAFEARRSEWVRRKEQAAAAGIAGPEPLTQYLVSEVVVTGVFDTDTGLGAFVMATPTGNTFFVSPGASLYNGRLVEIVPGSSGFVEDTEIVFAERGGKAGGERRVVKRVEPAPSPAESATP